MKPMKVTNLVRLSILALASCASFAFLLSSTPAAAEKPAPEPAGASAAAAAGPFAALKFRYIGPEGNRVSSVAGVPGDPNVYYAGAASGGIWKTTDGGVHWRPI